jgi:hypothetical protein
MRNASRATLFCAGVILLGYYWIERDEMNSYKASNSQCDQFFAGHKKLDDGTVDPHKNLATDSFDIWWLKTFAQNRAVFARASNLRRTLQRLNGARRQAL